MNKNRRFQRRVISPESVKAIREAGLKDYQAKLVVIKSKITAAKDDLAKVTANIEKEKAAYSFWVKTEEQKLKTKRDDTNVFVKKKRETLAEKLKEEIRLIRENNKILTRIEKSEKATAEDLHRIQILKKDATQLEAQSKVAEEKATAQVKNYQTLIKENEALLIKTRRELEVLSRTKQDLIELNAEYDKRITSFKKLRKEVIAIENKTAQREARITEKLKKMDEIAKAEGDDL